MLQLRHFLLLLPLLLLVIVAGYLLLVLPSHNNLPVADFVPKGFEPSSQTWLNQVNVKQIIQIQSPNDVFNRRQNLSHYLFGQATLPATTDISIAVDIQDLDYQKFYQSKILQQINRLTVTMDFGINSVIYHFIPRKSNQKIVFYHEGHEGDFRVAKQGIYRLLSQGYDVLAFAMPLLGKNSQPTIKHDRLGLLKLRFHNDFRFLALDANQGHALKFLLQPVIAMWQHFNTQSKPIVAMIGFDGGAWVTTLFAALQPDLLRSYAVAGSFPHYLQDWQVTEYEQTDTALYYIANWLELYILASYGQHRQHVQILNRYDPCCFMGTAYRSYKNIIQSRLRQLGHNHGYFNVFLDESHKQHKISKLAWAEIIADLKRFESLQAYDQ